MKLDTKQRVLVSIYTEYQKDVPNMAENITSQKLDMDWKVFRMTIVKLNNEGLINSAIVIPDEEGTKPPAVNVRNIMISSKGIEYVEEKLQIDKTLSNTEKLKDLSEKAGKWGWEQVKDFAAKTLAEIISKAAGNN